MITINGKSYKLRFDLYAMEQIEEEFGSLKEAFDLFRAGRKQAKMVRKLFQIMANSALSYEGKPEAVTDDELRHLPIGRINEIAEAVNAAIADGMKTEMSGGGEADDEEHDAYLEEVEKKSVETGGQLG